MDLLKTVRFDIQGAGDLSLHASYEAPDHLADSIGDVITGPMSDLCQGILLGMALGRGYEVSDVESIYLQGRNGALPGLILHVPKRCDFGGSDSPKYEMPTASPVAVTQHDRWLQEGAAMSLSAIGNILNTINGPQTIPVAAVGV